MSWSLPWRCGVTISIQKRPQDRVEFSLVLRGLFRYLTLLFSLPVLFILGGPIWEGVWQALKNRLITTDLLITLGVLAAYLYSIVSVVRDQGHVYFEVGCMVLVFVTLGRWLEAHGKLQTSAALDALADLLPDQVRRVRNAESYRIENSRDRPRRARWPKSASAKDSDSANARPRRREPLPDGFRRDADPAMGEKVARSSGTRAGRWAAV